jgi:hypothetical protein
MPGKRFYRKHNPRDAVLTECRQDLSALLSDAIGQPAYPRPRYAESRGRSRAQG